MGVLTASGGACDIIADSASAQGIEIPDFAPETAAAIARHLPPFAVAKNPLDVTGYGLAHARVLGLGGIWVEVLNDTSLRVLPVDAGEVKHMLAELRGLPLLRGARGARPADLDVLASVITVLGDAAVSLNGALRALEVNPLWVNGDQVEALDVLVITEPDGSRAPEAESDGAANLRGAAEMELTT
jgi:hypothetical protein